MHIHLLQTLLKKWNLNKSLFFLVNIIATTLNILYFLIFNILLFPCIFKFPTNIHIQIHSLNINQIFQIFFSNHDIRKQRRINWPV